MTGSRVMLLLPLLLAVASPAMAQWRENGKVVEDDLWRRSDGDFGGMLLLTDQPDGFIEQWNRPAAPDYQPSIQTVSDASHGDVVAAMILFSRCGADFAGECRVVADFRVVRPDGGLYAEHEGAPVWKAAAPDGTALQLSETHLAFRIEPEDPDGVYEIHATVRDLVSSRVVHLVQRLRVLPGPAKPAR